MFSKILIANRGEIAVRIIRACKEMGILTVAVFSEADRDALHVSLADESYCIGPAPVKDSYLNMSSIISTAVLSGAQAIHPGYGLLSENAKFAKLCKKSDIAFIGPTPEVISLMGDKEKARSTMQQSGVPVVPGSDLVNSLEEAVNWGEKIGYPLLVKARSGGGGRGMRKVNDKDEMEKAFLAAIAEAKSAFGDGGVYLEKYLSPVKHIEMQLLCDNHGNAVCLGERECSMQRKHQKLIEESPSPAVSKKTRKNMIEVAIKAAEAVKYTGLGTIEFLMSKDGSFYFMEMNTRLQVEHPVTEMITGIDLVKWQIRVAADLPLDMKQKNVKMNGHAIECRINAEDPRNGFRPSCGKIELLHIPGGPQVRFDSALYQGYKIPPFYDSMVGKLIVQAQTRDEAIRKMLAALCELVIEGIEQNRELQIDLISDKEFRTGTYTTDFLERRE
ncbi:MAG: acetyl-CoA carboxylase biotin carboxylase subunit [Eubacteriales bacterium]